MKAGVLFSGGKDSALAAVLLARDYEVELNTFVFDPCRRIPSVEKAAAGLGFPHFMRIFDAGVLEEAVDMVIKHGFPNRAISMVHHHAVRQLLREYTVVADGTRFNDRVPSLSRDEVFSLQDKSGGSYVRPLLGYGSREVTRLALRLLEVSYGETGTIANGDYEREIREAIQARGIDISGLFPANHEQSLVLGRSVV